MSSILFAKRVSFEHSVSSPRPVITSRREKKQQQDQSFSSPNRQSVRFILSHQPARLSPRAVGARSRCSEFLSNRKYRYRSYTQTDDTHCWPCAVRRFKMKKNGLFPWVILVRCVIQPGTISDKPGIRNIQSTQQKCD